MPPSVLFPANFSIKAFLEQGKQWRDIAVASSRGIDRLHGFDGKVEREFNGLVMLVEIKEFEVGLVEDV